MIYEVKTSILFDSEDEARDYYHDCELALSKGTSINTDSENAEYSTIVLNESNHDLDPNAPSFVLLSDSNNPLP